MSAAVNYFSLTRIAQLYGRGLRETRGEYTFYVEMAEIHGAHSGHVLEICAGAGNLCQEFQRRGYVCDAVDGSQTMIRYCQTVLPPERTHLIDLEQADWPFEKDTFDMVVCQRGLFYLRNNCAVAANMLAALKPGGLFLGDFITHTKADGLRLEGIIRDKKAVSHIPLYSVLKPYVDGVFENSGCEIEYYDGSNVNDRYTFPRPVHQSFYVARKL